MTARISQRYDSQIDGYHVISERSIEETLGTIAQHDSKRVFTMDSIKSVKEINSKGAGSVIMKSPKEHNLIKIQEEAANEEVSPPKKRSTAQE